MDTQAMQRLKFLGWFVYGLVVLYCVWIVVLAIINSMGTGVLHIKSADSGAGIIVRRDGYQAISGGVGESKLRLAPGTYQVSVNDKGKIANAVVNVSKKHTTNITLNPTKKVTIPSVTDVDFEGTGALLDSGITTSQINKLELYIFQFKPTEQTVSVNTSSVYPAAHDPNKDISFAIDFNVSIDSVNYKAVISYVDLDNLALSLRDSTGSVVFTAGSTN